MVSSLLAALALGQVVPDTASVIYPCFPETVDETEVQLLTHDARYQLDVATVSFESLSTLRNDSSRPVTLTLNLPVRGNQVNWKQTEQARISASINNKSVNLTAGQVQRVPPTRERLRDGVWARTYARSYTLKLSFQPRETKSLRVKFSAPIGRAGLDGAQRTVVYETSGAANWNGTVRQFNFAVQDPSKRILQVFAALPEVGWKIGTSGAFVRFNNYNPPRRPHLIFTYYPNTFERIGDGGDPTDPPHHE